MKFKQPDKFILLMSLFFLLVSPLQALSAGLKVGTISLQDVLAQSNIGKEAQKQLEGKVQEFQQKFSKEQEGLEALGAEVEKKRSVWSKDILEEKERDYQMKMREFKLKTDDAQFELKQLEKKVMEPILKDLHELIAEYGKKEGYTMIFENTRKGLTSRTGLLYAAEEIDITKEILKLLDARTNKK
ncbi:MAG: OmpH family outer membrane protein [Deltaproteobacteria bacterium]|nr:OmpH family outer membrane protein [Deltaproteobacteria bacterium]